MNESFLCNFKRKKKGFLPDFIESPKNHFIIIKTLIRIELYSLTESGRLALVRLINFIIYIISGSSLQIQPHRRTQKATEITQKMCSEHFFMMKKTKKTRAIYFIGMWLENARFSSCAQRRLTKKHIFASLSEMLMKWKEIRTYRILNTRRRNDDCSTRIGRSCDGVEDAAFFIDSELWYLRSTSLRVSSFGWPSLVCVMP